MGQESSTRPMRCCKARTKALLSQTGKRVLANNVKPHIFIEHALGVLHFAALQGKCRAISLIFFPFKIHKM